MLTFYLQVLLHPQVTGQPKGFLLPVLCLLLCPHCPASAAHDWATNRCFGCSLNAEPWNLKLSPLGLVFRKPATTPGRDRRIRTRSFLKLRLPSGLAAPKSSALPSLS